MTFAVAPIYNVIIEEHLVFTLQRNHEVCVSFSLWWLDLTHIASAIFSSIYILKCLLFFTWFLDKKNDFSRYVHRSLWQFIYSFLKWITNKNTEMWGDKATNKNVRGAKWNFVFVNSSPFERRIISITKLLVKDLHECVMHHCEAFGSRECVPLSQLSNKAPMAYILPRKQILLTDLEEFFHCLMLEVWTWKFFIQQK